MVIGVFFVLQVWEIKGSIEYVAMRSTGTGPIGTID